ncbi:MAG: queuosine precursor transporter [Bacilli bacterium]|nr:queuosine precursor transporter [Bacilli bacterium]
MNIKRKKNTNQVSELFLYLSIVFIVCLLLSNILAAKLLKLGPYSITSGVIVFPISYIISDIISEVYGFDKSKKVIILGFIMNLFMILVFSLAIILPSPSWFENDKAFNTILGSTQRNSIASLIAYLCGTLVNSKVLVKMKERKNNKFGVRAIVSTIFGEFTDSLIFVLIAFTGLIPASQLLTMIILQVLIKTLYEIVCLPVTTKVVRKVKLYENIST